VILLSDEPQADKIHTPFSDTTFSNDLIFAVVWLAASLMAIYVPPLNETSIEAIIVLPGILFIPGYCLIAALFPWESDIDLTERIVLSLGLSLTVVPLIALLLNFTPYGIYLDPVVISLTIFTLAMILVAQFRRALLPFEKRFRFPFFMIAHTLQHAVYPRGQNRIGRLVTVTITIAFIISVIATVYVIAVPKEGERYTEFFILGENQTAAGYPDRISVGQNYPMYVGIGNHEHQITNYTIETWLTHTEFDNVTNTSRIITMDPGKRLTISLYHNETRIIPYNLSIENSAYNRVEFLLFKERVPGSEVTGNDRINMSYRNVNLWFRENI